MSATTGLEPEAADFGYFFETYYKDLYRLAVSRPGSAPRPLKHPSSGDQRHPGIGDRAYDAATAPGRGDIGVGVLDAPALSMTSRVYFAPGYEAEALDVARLLGLGASAANRTPPPVPDPNGADVLVVIGTDVVGSSAGPAVSVQ